MRTRSSVTALALVLLTVAILGAGVASAVEGGGAPPPPPGGAPPPEGGGAPPPEGGGAPPPEGGAPPPEGGAPPEGGGAPPPGGGEEIDRASEECIHLLEGGGKIDDCQEAPNPILPEMNELIWGSASFLVLLFLLWKLALPGMKKTMDARSEKIRSSLDEADRARSEAQAVLADYQRQLADAKGEAGRIIDDARQTAESVKRDLMSRAEAEAEEQRRRNNEQIAAERERVMSELQDQVAMLAVEMAERVVKASLDRDASLRLIEDYISTVGGSGNGSGDGKGNGSGDEPAAAKPGGGAKGDGG